MKSSRIILLIICIVALSQIIVSEEIKTIEVYENDLVDIKPVALDEDGDSLTFNFSKPLNASGQWQTKYGDAGEYDVLITVSDGKAQTSKKLFLIVSKSNRPPVMKNLSDLIVDEGDVVDLELDVYDEENDEIKFKISNPIGNDRVWETNYESAGEYNIKVEATDGLHTVSDSFKLIVKNVNRDPKILGFSPKSETVNIKEGESAEFNMNVIDEDKDNLSYIWKLNNEKVSTANSYIFNSGYEDAGEYTLIVDISDGNSIVRQSWTVFVSNVNRAPALEQIPDITVKETEKIILNISASDPDGDDILYKIDEPIGKDKEWQTDYNDSGIYNIKIVVSDGALETSKTAKITVLNVDRAPFFKKINDTQIKETEKAVVVLNSEDPDGDNVKYSSDNLPYGAAIKGNVIEFTPNYDTILKPNNWMNTWLNILHLDWIYRNYFVFNFDVTASGSEKNTTQNVKIRVDDVNRAPVISYFNQINVNETNTVYVYPNATDPDNDRLEISVSDPVGNDRKWKTDYDSAGQYFVWINVTDGQLSASKQLKIIVNNTNREPTIKAIKSMKIYENEEIRIIPVVFDPDNESLQITLQNNSVGARFFNNTLIWTPSFDIASKGADKDVIITFVVKDKYGAVAKQDALITVRDVNRMPAVKSASPDFVNIKEGESVVFDADAVDYDGDNLTYTWKFGIYDFVENSIPRMNRTFVTAGEKTVKLIISDGDYSITKKWTVNVAEKAEIKFADKKTEVKTEPKKTEVKVEPKKVEVKVEPKKTELKKAEPKKTIAVKPTVKEKETVKKTEQKEVKKTETVKKTEPKKSLWRTLRFYIDNKKAQGPEPKIIKFEINNTLVQDAERRFLIE